MVGRKIGLAQKASHRVLDLTKSNESTISIQETEISGIKRAVDELQKVRRSLAEEEGRDEQRLARIYDALQVSEMFVQSSSTWLQWFCTPLPGCNALF